jgi:ubiquinone/menaquinone biosynthesis C-methylase UbiE
LIVFLRPISSSICLKAACDTVLKEVRRILKPGGKFMILGPNIRYACKEYWDYYDHYLALSHLSLVEGLTLAGYRPEKPSSIVSYPIR